jgi:plasmid stability protein
VIHIYVVMRNITFSLPADLVRQAKVYAAEHDTTINSLVRELLQEKLTREGRARAAADRLLALAERGPYFTTDPGSIRREELHERR